MRAGTRGIARSLRPAVGAVRSLQRAQGLTVIGWHRIDGRSSHGLSTGVEDFCRHLDELESWGAVVLPLDVAVSRLLAGTLPAKAVAFTFDDGYASVVETAWPILRSRGLPATLFVVSDCLRGELRFAWDRQEMPHQRIRLARPDEIAEAAHDGLDIGSHTTSHSWLPGLSAGEVERELTHSRTALEELLGRQVTSLAYPSGGWNPQVRSLVESAGYRIGITVDRGRNHAHSNPLSLRRAFAPTDPADLRLLLDGAYTFLRPVDTWRTRKGPAW